MTRFCVFCGERRDPSNGKKARGVRLRLPSTDRCGEDAHTTAVRFDGTTGERLEPPPMPRRSLLTSYAGNGESFSRLGHGDTIAPLMHSFGRT